MQYYKYYIYKYLYRERETPPHPSLSINGGVYSINYEGANPLPVSSQ